MAPRSTRSSSRGPSLTPVFLAMAALIGGVLVVAVLQNKDKEKKAAAAAAPGAAVQPAGESDAPSPFADRNNDPPTSRSGSKMGTENTAPEGLAETALWADSKVMADEGMKLVKEAVAARKKGDEDTYRTKGLEGYELLDQALMNTGDWLFELQQEHPNDSQVSRIGRHRERWGNAYKKVRKIK